MTAVELFTAFTHGRDMAYGYTWGRQDAGEDITPAEAVAFGQHYGRIWQRCASGESSHRPGVCLAWDAWRRAGTTN